MSEYHVGCGLFGIYAGKLKKNKSDEWQDKSEVTEEALQAVANYMYDKTQQENTNEYGYAWTLRDGRALKLICKVE